MNQATAINLLLGNEMKMGFQLSSTGYLINRKAAWPSGSKQGHWELWSSNSTSDNDLGCGPMQVTKVQIFKSGLEFLGARASSSPCVKPHLVLVVSPRASYTALAENIR